MGNRLLLTLVAISLAVHAVLFLRIAGLYDSRRVMSYIELTLQDVSKPFARSIPRPRPRHETPPVHDARQTPVRQTQIPRIDIKKMAPDLSQLTAVIDVPDILPVDGAHSAGWGMAASSAYGSREDYFDMIRMRIESRKQYPPEARRRHMEGRVGLRFTVLADGNLSSLEIVGTPHEILKAAALKAVTDAAPFPRPPPKFFTGPMRIEIALVFELMPGAGKF